MIINSLDNRNNSGSNFENLKMFMLEEIMKINSNALTGN